jgi:hypothetical protein
LVTFAVAECLSWRVSVWAGGAEHFSRREAGEPDHDCCS